MCANQLSSCTGLKSLLSSECRCVYSYNTYPPLKIIPIPIGIRKLERRICILAIRNGKKKFIGFRGSFRNWELRDVELWVCSGIFNVYLDQYARELVGELHRSSSPLRLLSRDINEVKTGDLNVGCNCRCATPSNRMHNGLA